MLLPLCAAASTPWQCVRWGRGCSASRRTELRRPLDDQEFYSPRVLGRGRLRGCKKGRPADAASQRPEPQPVAELGEHPAGAVAGLAEGVARRAPASAGSRPSARSAATPSARSASSASRRRTRSARASTRQHSHSSRVIGGLVRSRATRRRSRSASAASAAASTRGRLRDASSTRTRSGSAAASSRVARGDRAKNASRLALEAVGARARRRARARPAAGSIASSSVRSAAQPAGRELVDRAHRLDAEPAPGALVGERGVDVAVEQDPAPGRQRRLDALGDELRARGGVEQRLGAGVDRERRVLHERADPLGDDDAARLAQREHVDSALRRAPRRAPPASVVLPAPSIPSIVISAPRATTAQATLRSVQALPGIDRHPHARAVLVPALPPGQASHAYLFGGPAGAGKRAIARAFRRRPAR